MDTLIPFWKFDKYKHLIGKQFGRITIIIPYNLTNKHLIVKGICSCGKEWQGTLNSLKKGNTNSCGCYALELIKNNDYNKTHGMKGTPEYTAYQQAKNRATNIKDKDWRYYGGRGIEFRFNSFEEFFREVGFKPTYLHSIDRINNNGHYEIGNIRWATKKEQILNRRNMIA